jgi:cytochrome c peroxidase
LSQISKESISFGYILSKQVSRSYRNKMQRIKLFVFLAFIVFIGVFYGTRLTIISVSGQSGTPAAPTGVRASDGNYANKVGVMWDTMRGATLYRIFRNTANNSATATAVGTTAANYFFDSTAQSGQTYFYWVKAENGSNVSSFSATDQGARGNGTVVLGPFPPLDPPTVPSGNPVTATKAYLGKTLFWDEQMSSTKTVSCGTCHRSSEGGSDPRTVFNGARSQNPGFDNIFNTADDVFGSPGVPTNNANGTYTFSSIYKFNEQVSPRKAPSYLNAAYSPNGVFWDGRATDVFRDPLTNAIVLQSQASLESQVLGPPVNSGEMAHTGRDWAQVATRISQSKPLALASNVPTALQTWINGRTYPQLFEEAFGTPEVTPARIAMAIATHERGLFSDQTPLDKSESSIEPLTMQEQNGRNLFVNLQCNTCHDGSLMSDHQFHNIGVRPQNEDLGRGVVTSNADDNGRFKTPNLRNIELRAPYMHNGRFNTLEEVIEFYNRGGDFDAPNIDHGVIRPLNLSDQEKAELVAFLRRPLTDLRVRDELSPFDRPQLFSESARVPVIVGSGVAGSGGLVPSAMAIEPPLLGNPSFTVAVSKALGNSNAVLVVNSTDPGIASIPSTGSFTRQTLTLAGTGAGNGNGSISLAIPDNPALIGQTFFGRWYVSDASAVGGFSVSQAFRFTVFGTATAINRPAFVDFDGDRKTDISIFRPSNGQWWYSKSSDNQTLALQFGLGSDKIVPADFSGDGRTDIAVWRPSSGEWFILRSENNSFYSLPFGASGDIPAPADYDADGKADLAVFRPSTATWYLQASTNGTLIYSFGQTGDIPQVGDYDGDGKSDIAIFRPNVGQWWINRSATNTTIATTFGISTDKPLAQDFTGDGKTDIAFYRPSSGEWFILKSEDANYYSVPFGAAGDLPTPGDYDGDGKADTAVFRPATATWYVNRSTQGLLIASFGTNGDKPVPNAFVP